MLLEKEISFTKSSEFLTSFFNIESENNGVWNFGYMDSKNFRFCLGCIRG